MNELLQKHGCANVFHIPEGLKELMADITREVLRAQPQNLLELIAEYLSALLITREHGVLSTRLLEDLCDCKPSMVERLLAIGIETQDAEALADIINETITQFDFKEGQEKVIETNLIKKMLKFCTMESDVVTKICYIARNAFRDYCYRKSLLENKPKSDAKPWEIAADHTLAIYKQTKPSFGDLCRAASKIQAAYRGYHTRRYLLNHLDPRKQGPKKELPGPPLDIAESREIDLGPCMKVDVPTDDVNAMLDALDREKLNLAYDPHKVLTDGDYDEEKKQSEMEAKNGKEITQQGALKIVISREEFGPESKQKKEVNENDFILQYSKSTKTESMLAVKDKSDIIKVPIEDNELAENESDSKNKSLMKKASTEGGHKVSTERSEELRPIVRQKFSIDNAVKYKIIDDDDDD